MKEERNISTLRYGGNHMRTLQKDEIEFILESLMNITYKSSTEDVLNAAEQTLNGTALEELPLDERNVIAIHLIQQAKESVIRVHDGLMEAIKLSDEQFQPTVEILQA
jgi:predicted NUDIX family phosphoesterase